MLRHRLAQNPFVVVFAALEQDDPAIAGKGVENDGESRAVFVRIGAADARPSRFAAAGTFDGIGDEDGIGGHS